MGVDDLVMWMIGYSKQRGRRRDGPGRHQNPDSPNWAKIYVINGQKLYYVIGFVVLKCFGPFDNDV